MKKYLHYFLAAVIAPACLAGCSSDNDDAGATDAVMLRTFTAPNARPMQWKLRP